MTATPKDTTPASPETEAVPKRRRAPETVAAVDLGSNSFHMIVARVQHGQLQILDRLQETVRLGAGLDHKNRLSREARERAIGCLERFGQRLSGMNTDSVRAVGTNTLRRARRAEKFLEQARTALGHPIEIISGREEARLIYLGVARELPDEGPRLVIDIGGGSTELIIGEQLEPAVMESLHMGCVSMSKTHFPDGRITGKAMRQAVMAARAELQPVESQFRSGWRAAYGSSGTIRAIAAVLRAMGLNEPEITPPSLAQLRSALLDAGHIRNLSLPGLAPERAPVFAGGIAILCGLFESLDLQGLRVSDSALREGLLYDLLGRLRSEDVRGRTISALSTRYHVDRKQAVRVEATAQECFRKTAESWKLSDDDAALLSWAARLHEIGLAVAHSGYHKHGAYLARYSDLAGFSSTEQQMLAILIRAHRHKLPTEDFTLLPKPQARKARRLSLLLRLAVLLHRARTDAALPEFGLMADGRSISVEFPSGWLSQNPLTRVDLQRETEYLTQAGIQLYYT